MAEGICALCGNWEELEKHHIFQGSLRKKADKLGMTVKICRYCHQVDADSAHQSYETRVLLRKTAQRKAMEKLGWTAADFIREFGRNYLDADELTEDGRLAVTETAGDNLSAFRLVEPIPLMF